MRYYIVFEVSFYNPWAWSDAWTDAGRIVATQNRWRYGV